MKSKHEQLYVAVQDLLIELGVTPEKLRDIARRQIYNPITPKTAQKLIDAELVIKEINWKNPNNDLYQKIDKEETILPPLFNTIHSSKQESYTTK